MEAFRVSKPGGTAIVTSENLCSLLNCLALFLGYTPFSLMQTCGRYLGNPLGLHYNETLAEPLPLDHPAFSGSTIEKRPSRRRGSGLSNTSRSSVNASGPSTTASALRRAS